MPFNAESIILPVNQQFATSVAGGRWKHTMTGTGTGTTSGLTQFSLSSVYNVQWSSGMDAGTWVFTGAKMNDSTTLVLGNTITKTIVFAPSATTSAAPPDTTAPLVSIDFPLENDTYGGSIELQYTISDCSNIALTQLIVTTTGAAISSSGKIWPVLTPFDTTTSMNGKVALAIRAVDASTGANETTVTRNIIVFNPTAVTSSGTPSPDLSRKIAIINRLSDGRVVAALWAPVPTPAQPQFAQAGKVSAWTLASTAQNDAIASGAIAERIRVLPTQGLTDQQIRDLLQAEWATFNDGIDDLGIWPLVNNVWNGILWST